MVPEVLADQPPGDRGLVQFLDDPSLAFSSPSWNMVVNPYCRIRSKRPGRSRPLLTPATQGIVDVEEFIDIHGIPPRNSSCPAVKA